MNNLYNENNSAPYGEQNPSNEFTDSSNEYGNNANENFNSSENFNQNELNGNNDNSENNENKNGGKNNGNKSKNEANQLRQMMQLLATTTVTVAVGGTAIIAPIVAPPATPPQDEAPSDNPSDNPSNTPSTDPENQQPTISMVKQNEVIGVFSYSCSLLTVDTDDELTAKLTDASGQVETLSIIEQSDRYSVEFSNLAPETDYTLSVYDGLGNEYHSSIFKTQPFIVFSEPIENIINFTLSAEISFENDFILLFLDKDGKDFSSNLNFDFGGETGNFIILDGLYSNDYVVHLELYTPSSDEPIVYEKSINLGSLTPIDYTLEYVAPGFIDGHQFNFTYNSGDIRPYTISQIEIIDEATYNTFTITEFQSGNNNEIYATLYETIENGTYKVVVYGEYSSTEYSLFNQLWVGEITINN